MFSSIKRWFGFEGLQMRLHVAKQYPKDITSLNGDIEFVAKGRERVDKIQIRFIESYSHGRGAERRSKELLLGDLLLDEPLIFASGEEKLLRFELPFQFEKSNMDAWEEGNFLQKGLAKFAKRMRQVESSFRIEVEVWVEGQQLSWRKSKPIEFIEEPES